MGGSQRIAIRRDDPRRAHGQELLRDGDAVDHDRRHRRTRLPGWPVGFSGVQSTTVSFSVGADAYDRFMGRYSSPLAPVFAEFAVGVDAVRVLDVGCGPGALTTELVKRLGPAAVAAVDPSDAFVTAAQERYPAVDVLFGSPSSTRVSTTGGSHSLSGWDQRVRTSPDST